MLSAQNNRNYKLASVLYSLYSRVQADHFALISALKEISSTWIVNAILEQLVEDVLAPDISTGEVLNVRSDDKKIQYELDYLQELLDFDLFVRTILPDLLLYGEYIVSTRIEQTKLAEADDAAANADADVKVDADSDKGKSAKGGLVGLVDDVEQGRVIALCDLYDVQSYLYVSQDNKFYFKNRSDYVRFVYNTQKIDIWQELKLTPEDIKTLGLPRFVRRGKSLFYGLIEKIKELQLLEALVPATKLAQLSSGTTVGVSVPAGYDIEKAIETVKKVEGVLNKKLSVDYRNKSLSAADIVSAAGNIKVVPIFGDKGNLQKLDYKQDEPTDLVSSIEDVRRTICSSIGFPYELMFSGESNKGETLRRQSRYLRKIKNIQRSLCDGIREIIYIHLANKGIPFKREDLIVDFRNKLVEIDLLDKLEFVDASVNFLSNVTRFFQDNMENQVLSRYIDETVVVQFLRDNFRLLGADFFLKEAKQQQKNGRKG